MFPSPTTWLPSYMKASPDLILSRTDCLDGHVDMQGQ